MTTTAITSGDFFKRLEEDRFGDIQVSVDFEVTIDASTISWHHRIIKDVIFKEKIVIRDCELNSGIKFTNCKFEKGVVFHNVKSTNYNSTYNQNNESVCFENSEATKITFENNCFLDRSLTFKKECKIDKLDITNFENRNAGISIRNSNLNYLSISHSKTEINLSNSIFQKSTRFETILGDVSFIKNEFVEDIMIWNLECPNRFVLNYNFFKDNFEIEASRLNALNFIGDNFEKKGKLENRDMSGNNLPTYLKKLYISEVKFIEGFEFYGLGKEIEGINLPLTPTFEGLIKFEGWKVDQILLSGVNQNLKLLFKRSSFRFFMINDFTNYSDISFDKCNGFSDCTLNLSDCDLGSTRFSEFDFNSFLEIRIDNVTLDKINPTSSNWFKDEKLKIGDGNQSKEDEYKRKRDVYRQIKQALKNNGNQIDSLTFQARELSTYKKELEISTEKTFGDKIIMWVSETNDFGLNWIKPVYIVFLTTLIIYLIILPSISKDTGYTFAKNSTDVKNTFNAFLSNGKILWQLFNPIRKMDDVYCENANGWIYLVDLLHRIFLGIMIFQIIKAFRKYVSN